ncbi:PadR family transcriptional regulator [Microbacterium sp. zg-YB36]|uniref:PadR family transcriptional regulator n=1 Tax=Microbacterium sp. zg-YB36 TaxID=2969407 RepID=UPI00214BADB0|nr:PadR family transcriptional regulator [Microbacterium sp. zg-YB36]MDL5351539.1 PadR family transcriptional regulator [Microbacterium sp. zg-YB36]
MGDGWVVIVTLQCISEIYWRVTERRSIVKYVVLGLLMIQPLSLYDLHKAFRAGISLFYSASFGSLQRSLSQLIEEGLVVAEPEPGDPRGKKRHTITDAGRIAWRDGMLTPPVGADAETVMLSRVFFLGLLDADDRKVAVGLLRSRAADDLANLQAVAVELDSAEIPADLAGVFKYQRATLDYGIRSHTLAQTWLNELPE